MSYAQISYPQAPLGDGGRGGSASRSNPTSDTAPRPPGGAAK